MKMDIACPVELMSVEKADFGGARSQAYLSFLNESPYAITALSGRLTLLDASGIAVMEERVSFGDLNAPAWTRFTCHLPTDDYPDFLSASMIIEDVLFDSAEAWALHPTRLKDYEIPALEEGPERNALIAVAGYDAICYPARGNGTWVCVCGRFNRWRWPVCRRCQRSRDDVMMTYTPENVQRLHQQRIDEENQLPPETLIYGKAQSRVKKGYPFRFAQLLSWIKAHGRYIAVGILAALVVAAVLTLLSSRPATKTSGGITSQTIHPAVELDYLEAMP